MTAQDKTLIEALSRIGANAFKNLRRHPKNRSLVQVTVYGEIIDIPSLMLYQAILRLQQRLNEGYTGDRSEQLAVEIETIHGQQRSRGKEVA